jgi:hypothetical protein
VEHFTLSIIATGTAEIRPKNSTKIIYIKAEQIVWEKVSSSVREMGEERTWEGGPDRGPFQYFKWVVVEYPVGGKNYASHDFGGGTLEKDFDYTFE